MTSCTRSLTTISRRTAEIIETGVMALISVRVLVIGFCKVDLGVSALCRFWRVDIGLGAYLIGFYNADEG